MLEAREEREQRAELERQGRNRIYEWYIQAPSRNNPAPRRPAQSIPEANNMIKAIPLITPLTAGGGEPSVLVNLLLIASIAGGIAYIALILPHMVAFAYNDAGAGRDLLASNVHFIAGPIIAALNITAFTYAIGDHLGPDSMTNMGQACLIALTAVPVIMSTGYSLALMSTAWHYPHEADSLRHAGLINAIISIVPAAPPAAAMTTLIITAQTGSNPAG